MTGIRVDTVFRDGSVTVMLLTFLGVVFPKFAVLAPVVYLVKVSGPAATVFGFMCFLAVFIMSSNRIKRWRQEQQKEDKP